MGAVKVLSFATVFRESHKRAETTYQSKNTNNTQTEKKGIETVEHTKNNEINRFWSNNLMYLRPCTMRVSHH